MKKITGLFTALLLMFVCVNFSSCGDDAENDSAALADVVSGLYVGDGLFSHVAVSDEQVIPGMRVVISKSSNEYVQLDVQYADGESFFNGKASTYKVVATGNGMYTLDGGEHSKQRITITGNKLYYYNAGITSGGNSGFTLEINAKKER